MIRGTTPTFVLTHDGNVNLTEATNPFMGIGEA